MKLIEVNNVSECRKNRHEKEGFINISEKCCSERVTRTKELLLNENKYIEVNKLIFINSVFADDFKCTFTTFESADWHLLEFDRQLMFIFKVLVQRVKMTRLRLHALTFDILLILSLSTSK